MIRDKKVIFGVLIFIISSFSNYFIQRYNIHFQEQNQPEKIRFHQSIITQDDWSYISPIENFLQLNIWKENSFGNNSYFKRTPGYSWFIGIFIKDSKKITPHNLKILIGAQICLQALVPVILFFLFIQFKLNLNISFYSSLFFGVLPTFNGFTNYTLTESISPFLVIAFVYFALGDKKWKIILSALILAYLILVKPVFSPLILSYLFCLKPFNFKTFIILMLVGILPFCIWKIRSYQIDKQSISIHPIYHSQNKSVYRLPHKAIYELVKLYQPNGKMYHEWIAKMENNIAQNKPLASEIAMEIFPKDFILKIGKKQFNQSVQDFYQTLVQKNIYAQKGVYSTLEVKVAKEFENYRKQFITHYPIQSYIFTPLKVAKDMIFHSNLNLYIFQHQFRGILVMEIFRLISLIVHCSIFFIPILGWIVFKQNYFLNTFILTSGLIFLYFIIIQRGLEERYTYPFIVLWYAQSIYTLIILKNYINSKRAN